MNQERITRLDAAIEKQRGKTKLIKQRYDDEQQRLQELLTKRQELEDDEMICLVKSCGLDYESLKSLLVSSLNEEPQDASQTETEHSSESMEDL